MHLLIWEQVSTCYSSHFLQLGLGEPRPTRVTIQLADRSVKVHKGEITDVLIRVGDFIYLVDVIVLETQPMANLRSQTPVILGHLFSPPPTQ